MRTGRFLPLLALLLAAGPAAPQTVYLAFGDSITLGIGDTSETAGGYPERLGPLLSAGGIVEPVVKNFGVTGETTVMGLSRIGSVLAEGGDQILIMEGTNDMITAEISVETTAANLLKMANRANETGILPVLATIIPLRPSAFTTDDFELAKKLRQSALSAGIDLVDNYAVFDYTPNAWPDLYNTERKPDTVGHPNADGYDVIAETFADVLFGRDSLAPVLGDVKPADGSKEVSESTQISVVLFDLGDGIDTDGTTMRVDGQVVSAQRSGSKAKSTFTYTPASPLTGVITVEMEARDEAVPANRASILATTFSTAGTQFLKGDINEDGRVDGIDLVALAFSFGKEKGDNRYRVVNDLDSNGRVDGADLAILAGNFGKSSV